MTFNRNTLSLFSVLVFFGSMSVPLFSSAKAAQAQGEGRRYDAARGEQFAAAPKIPATIASSVEALDQHIAKGVEFLLNNQNPDGSWGSHHLTKGMNIACPVPEGPLAYRCATTALDVLALCACAPEDPKVQIALDKAQDWLLKNLSRMRRSDDFIFYNMWGHSYGIRALCALAGNVSPQSRAYAELKTECRSQMDKLIMQGSGDGGWGYIERDGRSYNPNAMSTSFCTATALLALRDAQKVFGLEVDKKRIDKAVRYLYNMRTPAGTYLYSNSHLMHPQVPINLHMGSLARTPVCNAALRAFGHKNMGKKEIEDGLEWLWARGGWLDMSRKKPLPHESFAQNSGYFFFYGYFYATECINMLDEGLRPRHAAFLSRVLLPLQEKDGAWWDYPLYNYHKQYGTGYALYSLALAREILYGSRYGEPSGI